MELSASKQDASGASREDTPLKPFFDHPLRLRNLETSTELPDVGVLDLTILKLKHEYQASEEGEALPSDSEERKAVIQLIKKEPIDNDKEKFTPGQISRCPTYFNHDDQAGDTGSWKKSASKTTLKNKRGAYERGLKDIENRWTHDMYNEEDQRSETRQEIARMYSRKPESYPQSYEDEKSYRDRDRTLPLYNAPRRAWQRAHESRDKSPLTSSGSRSTSYPAHNRGQQRSVSPTIKRWMSCDKCDGSGIIAVASSKQRVLDGELKTVQQVNTSKHHARQNDRPMQSKEHWKRHTSPSNGHRSVSPTKLQKRLQRLASISEIPNNVQKRQQIESISSKQWVPGGVLLTSKHQASNGVSNTQVEEHLTRRVMSRKARKKKRRKPTPSVQLCQSPQQVFAQAQAQMTSQAQAQMISQAQAQMISQAQTQMTTQAQAQMTSQVQAQMISQAQAQMISQAQAQMISQAQAQMTSQAQAQMTTSKQQEFLLFLEQMQLLLQAHLAVATSSTANQDLSQCVTSSSSVNETLSGVKMPDFGSEHQNWPAGEATFPKFSNGF